MASPHQGTSEADLNQVNLQMRSQPWYQQWFRAKGLDPNRVRLTEQQRQELTQLAAANGVELGDRMKFDEAGNVNQMGGFAGMPTWAKIALASAAVAGTGGALGAAGVGPMAGMFGGGGGGLAASVGAPAATEAAIFGSPAAMASGAGAAGAAGAAASGAGRGVASRVGEQAAQSGTDRLLNSAFTALAGLPGLIGSQNGPSDEERAYQAQASRLLGQQEQRTQYANPLYEATMKMAYGLLPNMGNGGNPYPINGLQDVPVPGMDALRTAQRRS